MPEDFSCRDEGVSHFSHARALRGRQHFFGEVQESASHPHEPLGKIAVRALL